MSEFARFLLLVMAQTYGNKADYWLRSSRSADSRGDFRAGTLYLDSAFRFADLEGVCKDQYYDC